VGAVHWKPILSIKAMLKKLEKTILAITYFIYDSKKIAFDFL